jgi:hypothetical protein
MAQTRTVALALFLSTLWVSGCAYKEQHFGYTREVRIGKIGCKAPFELPSYCPSATTVYPEIAPAIHSADIPAPPRPPAPRVESSRVEGSRSEAGRADSNRLSSEGWVGLPDF